MKLLLPDRLRQERNRRGQTQIQVGKAVDVSEKTIWNYETDNRCPMPTLEKIVDFFNEWNQRSSTMFPLLTIDDFIDPISTQNLNAPPNNTKPAQTNSDLNLPDLSRLPFRRNDFFTGRDTLLQSVLTESLNNDCSIFAISGLGGVGKTQLATEFAHRYSSNYKHVFWAAADSGELLQREMIKIARLLPEVTYDRTDERNAIPALKDWMASNTSWLLILDNADTPNVVEKYLPSLVGGTILLTSRLQSFDGIGKVVKHNLLGFSSTESVSFLKSRLQRRDFDAKEESCMSRLHDELHGLPLALEQAAAFITEKQISIEDFIVEFEHRRLDLLRGQKPLAGNYKHSLATTWLMNFNEIKKENQASIDLLRFTSILSSSTPIAYSFIADGASSMPSSLREKIHSAKVKSVAVAEALAPLFKYSLVQIQPNEQTYSVHPLVQEVVRDLNEL